MERLLAATCRGLCSKTPTKSVLVGVQCFVLRGGRAKTWLPASKIVETVYLTGSLPRNEYLKTLSLWKTVGAQSKVVPKPFLHNNSSFLHIRSIEIHFQVTCMGILSLIVIGQRCAKQVISKFLSLPLWNLTNIRTAMHIWDNVNILKFKFKGNILGVTGVCNKNAHWLVDWVCEHRSANYPNG